MGRWQSHAPIVSVALPKPTISIVDMEYLALARSVELHRVSDLRLLIYVIRFVELNIYPSTLQVKTIESPSVLCAKSPHFISFKHGTTGKYAEILKEYYDS